MKKFLFFVVAQLICFSSFGQFTYTLLGDPVTTTGWTYSSETSIVDSTIELTSPTLSQSGYIYYDSAIDLTTCGRFTVDFNFKIVPNSSSYAVADGIAFWYISNPPSGFSTGGGLGLPSYPDGLILVLDTYDNNGDGDNPLSRLLGYDGSESAYTEGSSTGSLTAEMTDEYFIDDASWHHCKIDYHSDSVFVYFNYSTTPTLTAAYTITLSTGYFGFSAGTGAAYSTQYIDSVVIVGSGSPLPPTVISPVTYCQYDTATPLTATGTNISWYTSDTATVALSGAPTPNTSVPGTTVYYLSQETSVGCVSPKDSIVVIVNAKPSPPVITADTAYCQGDAFVPITVTDTGVLWYTTGSGGVGSTTTPTVNTSISGSYTFYAAETVDGCSSDRDSVHITVHPTPDTPTITGQFFYCQDATFVPFTETGTNVLWYTTVGGTGSTEIPYVNTSVAGTYVWYVGSTIGNCSSPLDTITVVVYPTPEAPAISGPTSYCQGDVFIPFGVAGINILWYSTPTGGTGSVTPPTVNTAIPGTYTFYVTQTVDGCESPRSSITVVVNAGVTADFTAVVTPGCGADTVSFINKSSGETEQFWHFGDGNISETSDPTHIFGTGTYTVKLNVDNGACFDSTEQTFDLSHPIATSFSASPLILCEGQAVTFTNTSIGDTATYLWTFGDGTTDTATNPTHTFTYTGVYTVTLVEHDFVPCYDSAKVVVSVDSSAPVNFSISDSIICQGREVNLAAQYTSIGNTGIKWDFGDGATIVNENPATHSYNNITGIIPITFYATFRICPDQSVTKNITVDPYPIVNLGPDTSICPGSGAIRLIDPLNAYNPSLRWLWNTGDSTASIFVDKPGYYAATATNGQCWSTDTIEVRNNCYVDIPNAFTPNGDGVNDYFFPRQFLSAGLVDFQMYVYNRWGQQIFSSSNTEGRGWDGRFNGEMQPEGVYVYIIDVTFQNGSKEHHQGNVTLLR